MRRILLDENIPVGLRNSLIDHDVVTVEFLGWKGMTNGGLLEAAERARFDIFISADRNLGFQQQIGGRRLAIVILPTTRWREISQSVSAISDAIGRAKLGTVELVTFPT